MIAEKDILDIAVSKLLNGSNKENENEGLKKEKEVPSNQEVNKITGVKIEEDG